MVYQTAEQQSWPVAWQQYRLATGQREIESETFAKPAQIDEWDGRFDSKLLISQEAEESEAILPEVLVSAAGSNSNSRYEKGEKFEPDNQRKNFGKGYKYNPWDWSERAAITIIFSSEYSSMFYCIALGYFIGAKKIVHYPNWICTRSILGDIS